MTANLASGPLNLVKEMVFVRLYMTSKDATTLKYARGPMTGQTYRPSDDLESALYAYRVWMYENKPDGIGTEVSTLYPIAGIYKSFAEFLYKEYSYTRYGKSFCIYLDVFTVECSLCMSVEHKENTDVAGGSGIWKLSCIVPVGAVLQS